MKRSIFILFTFCCLLWSCNLPRQGYQNQVAATTSKTNKSEQPTSSTIITAVSPPKITSVDWDSGRSVIAVGIDPWPKNWEPWAVYVDGTEIPQGEVDGSISIRPNSPLDQFPDGLIIGTLPWVSGLTGVDFPCCGLIQFDLPGIGRTKPYNYNLRDQGCQTHSSKFCAAEWTVHDGDWIIEGSEPVIIEDEKIIQRGHIYIRDNATLRLKNSELRMERGSSPTVHVYIFVDPKGTLEIEGSRIFPGPGDSGLTCVFNRGTTRMIDSPTQIHYFDMSEGAELTMENSEMIGEIGGLLQMSGGSAQITNSTLGALALFVPAGAHLELSGLKSGAYFEQWKVQDWIPEANYRLSFDQVTVLKDNFTGEYEHGPYERGWIFFVDANSHVRLSDSELRKVFIDLRNDKAEFSNLKVGEPSNLKYRDIILDNVIVQGQWPFTITNANLTINDSNYLFLQPSGSSTITLNNSHIVEFIPREFTGSLIFENGSWTNAGEIIGGVDYHSRSNNFKIKGDLKIGDDVPINLQWKSAQVIREFNVILTDSQGNAIMGGVIKVDGREYLTDEEGLSSISIIFNETNYNQPMLMETWVSGDLVDERTINFFTETPIRVKQ